MRTVHLTSLVVAFVLGCSSSSAPSAEPSPTPATDTPDAGAPGDDASTPGETANPLSTAADALFTEAANAGTFYGTVILVEHGKTIFQKAYGLADRATERANTIDTILHLGSCSKQFVATGILALVADGELAVGDPLSKYFPDYPKENLTKDGVEVTLHHLLSHTSGLPDPRTTDWFAANLFAGPMAPNDQLAAVSAMPLVKTPGTEFAYTNYNYLLLALVIEKVTGQPYESFLKQRFFDPLGMTDTGTILPESKRANAAIPYLKQGKAYQSMTEDPTFADLDYTYAFGSGQIFTTIGDLARWNQAIDDGRTLPAAQRTLLFTPNLGDYGYGWFAQPSGGVDVQWHTGALPVGFTSMMIRAPSKERFGAWISNIDYATTTPLMKGFMQVLTQ